jgi:hypothetical protein
MDMNWFHQWVVLVVEEQELPVHAGASVVPVECVCFVSALVGLVVVVVGWMVVVGLVVS